MAIEPTGEMMQAFAEGESLREGLAAVLAIVGRDYCVQPVPPPVREMEAARPRAECPYCTTSLESVCPWHREVTP